tara:strand:- start:118 stop:819 length:702 start_codon:yes stop_codon:yes gene_type:complete
MKKIAFVPARSGSKRFPNKNITKLAGKPLLIWTLKSFSESGCFDKIIFSSDSEEYFAVVLDYFKSGEIEFHKRKNTEAGDNVKIFDFIKENINNFCNKEDLFVLGLPTCPLRKSIHIKESIELSIRTEKPVFSACEYDFHVPFAFSVESENYNPSWKPLFTNSPMLSGNTRSQDQIKYFHPNGAIYVTKPNFLRNDINTFYINAIPYLMKRCFSIDIDMQEDIELAEYYACKI